MQNVFQVLIVIVVLSTIQNPVCGKAVQFTADGFSVAADTDIWNAVDGNSVMTSVHAATNGWSLAVKEGDTVFFDNGVSSPLGFPDSATNSVSYAFVVFECTNRVDHATLIDAPCSIRFIPDPFNTPEAFFYESQLTNTVALSMNATPTNRFSIRRTVEGAN